MRRVESAADELRAAPGGAVMRRVESPADERRAALGGAVMRRVESAAEAPVPETGAPRLEAP